MVGSVEIMPNIKVSPIFLPIFPLRSNNRIHPVIIAIAPTYLVKNESAANNAPNIKCLSDKPHRKSSINIINNNTNNINNGSDHMYFDTYTKGIEISTEIEPRIDISGLSVFLYSQYPDRNMINENKMQFKYFTPAGISPHKILTIARTKGYIGGHCTNGES